MRSAVGAYTDPSSRVPPAPSVTGPSSRDRSHITNEAALPASPNTEPFRSVVPAGTETMSGASADGSTPSANCTVYASAIAA